MRVAIYARVSTDRQEQQGTIASQLDALRRYAQEQEHDVVEAYVCTDDGYSGTRLDRPGLDGLRDGAVAGAFEAVLVLCPDRLARKYAYQVLILEELERCGTRVIFLEQPPSEDPHARLLVQIQGVIAEYERGKIAERYRRGKLFRARQGEVICWKVPYGYRRIPRQDGVPAHVEVCEPEAQVVRQIFAWHVDERGRPEDGQPSARAHAPHPQRASHRGLDPLARPAARQRGAVPALTSAPPRQQPVQSAPPDIGALPVAGPHPLPRL